MGRVNATEPSQPVPLARLLAIAYRSLVDGLHGRLRDQGWVDVRPAFGFVALGVLVAAASLIGPNEVERIRRGLTGVLSDDHGVLPPVRPTW